jgi:hypothetical protein
MPLVSNVLSTKIQIFIKSLNAVEQKDADKAIKKFADELEKDIYSAIKSADIIIPPGLIQVMTPAGPGSNAAPIILQNVIK